MQLYFILSLIASIAVIIFAITNATAVPVRIFFAQYELSLALIIFISTALGAIIASTLGLVNHFKLKKQIKKLLNENQALTSAQNELQEELSTYEALKSAEPSPEDKNETTDIDV
jgi:uncharacterized integral membrane protein